MPTKPIEYFTLKELLQEAEKRHGLKIPKRRFLWWQQQRLLPAPEILSGKGHIGYYRKDALVRLVQVARARRSLRELRRVRSQVTSVKEVLAVMEDGVPTVIEIVGYQELPDGRTAAITSDGDYLIRNKTIRRDPPQETS